MNLTQSQLATPAFSVSYISAIERGQIRPSLRALEIIALRLGLSTTELLSGESIAGMRQGSATHPLPTINRGATVGHAREQDEEEIALALVEAHVALLQGAARRAIELCSGIERVEVGQHSRGSPLLRKARENRNKAWELQVNYLLGQAYFHIGQFEESKDYLLKAEQVHNSVHSRPGEQNTTLHSGPQYIYGRILVLLGSVYTALQNHEAALEAYRRCLGLFAANQFADPFFMARAYFVMGEHYLRRHQVDEAIEMLQRAVKATENITTPERREATCNTLYRDFLKASEYHLAASTMHKCLQLSDSRARLQARSLLYHYLYHSMANLDRDQAYSALLSALEQEKDGNDRLTVASINIHLAAYHFAQGAITDAWEYAQKAYDGARLFGDSVIAAEASVLVGHIAYTKSNAQDGDGHIVNGLEMLARLELREELANETERYAHLLESHGKAREALTYFKQAFKLREELSGRAM